ncbi:hypothetical protein BJ322DRAFT_1043170 [Thelephora terrestris]|uniref:Uncharacterized protein n=1 Tax=Thelephora terrestris TaxID=56493 RepID=A0A9P6HMM5_9AGAM|nr:hypothetical protein BJ322DRAFT_1043170 [Thelephora terrestris]
MKTREIDYGPFDAAVVLIEFASSDLWRNHLHPSNFATFEELLSSEEGKRTATERMFIAAIRPWQECLCAASKVHAAIGRLEELQCSNVAEFMIMWAWTVGILNVEDRDGWGSIERSTLSFYQLHGTGRVKALERHITAVSNHADLFLSLHEGPLNRLAKVQLRGSLRSLDWGAYLRISQVCQLRRLYFLFGRDSATREEAVEIEGAGKESDLLSAVTSNSIVDWACDYP